MSLKQKDKKNIWFINQYITSPKMCGASHRHFSLAKYLSKDNNITLFTGSYSHLHENKTKNLIVKEENVTIVNLPIYKYTNTLTRIFNFFHFVWKLRFFNYKKLEKPDAIIISTMSLFPLLLIDFYRKKFKNVKIIHEVRDIWPLTPIMLGGFSKAHPFIKLLAYCEKLGYKKADFFVSNLINADKHIHNTVPNRKKIPFAWISNGVDTQEETQSLSEKIKNKLPKNKFLIGYAGTIGIANTMNVVIEALQKIKYTNVCLCLVGNGDEKENLKKIAPNNVLFLDEIPKSHVNSFLKEMNVCILSWQKTKLYEYGISPNKIFDYMNAEKPIIMCGDMKNSIVEKSKCGWVVPAENSEKLAELLLNISTLNKEELQNYGERGKKYLDTHFKYSILASKYQKEVLDHV